MIPRKASDTLERLAKGFPIIALTGPRQSGKTTLAKAVFGQDKPYVSLKSPTNANSQNKIHCVFCNAFRVVRLSTRRSAAPVCCRGRSYWPC